MSGENIRHRKRILRRQHRSANSNEELANLDEQFQRRTGSTRAEKNLICTVCDGSAHGYNFDTITCESCKAFFRRNALRPDIKDKFKCRNGDNQCLVTVSTRKRCKACRLTKCFAKGMRADWILTDEERTNKRQKIEENRRLRQMLYPDSNDSGEFDGEIQDENLDIFFAPSLLTSDDLLKINQIQQAYTDSVRLNSLPPEIPSYPYTARIQETWCLMNLPGQLQSTRLITFCKFIPEFSSLNEQDKLTLTKYNTFPLLFIRSALIYDPVTDTYHDRGTDDCVFDGKDLVRCLSLHQYQQTTRCIHKVQIAAQNDSVVIQIFLLIILFSKGSTICIFCNEAEPIAENMSSIFQRQNFFVDLLWKYLEDKYGSTKTIDIWFKLILATTDAYLQAYNTRSNYIQNDPVADQLVPLMQSVILNV